jgi:hypothetical protein
MRRRAEGGFALISVLIVMLLLMAIGGAMHTSVMSETTLRGAHARATAGFYAAEAGINRGMGDYRNIFLAYSEPSGSDFDEKTIYVGPRTVNYQLTEVWSGDVQVPAGRPFAGLTSRLFKYVAQSRSQVHVGDTEVSLGTEFDVNYIPLFQFLAFYENDLEINPGPVMTLNGPIHTNGSLYLNSNATLSIADLVPGIPAVSVTAARSVYRGRKDTQNTPRCNGTVNIDRLADANLDGSLDARAMDCASSTTARDMTDALLSPWLGSIRARQPRVAVPTPAVLQVGTGDYWDRADLRLSLEAATPDTNGLLSMVVLNQGNTVDVAKTAILQTFLSARRGMMFYNDVPLSGRDNPDTNCATTPSTNTYCHINSYTRPFSGAFGSLATMYACAGNGTRGPWLGCPNYLPMLTLSTGGVTFRRGGFYNNREHAWVRMLNVNMRELLDWNRDAPTGARLIDNPDDDTDAGLVIFLTVRGPYSTGAINSRERYGVRVWGSYNLDFPAMANPTGLTVVSDQAIYVEGDYNRRPGNPGYDATYPKQPAAFMGDSINVLSNNWSGNPNSGWTPGNACRNDCQSRQTLNTPIRRPASDTVVNAAFLAGVDTTVAGPTGYNGGFENYPRFHESWTSTNLTYRGSFVSLGTPLRANGNWCGTGGSSSSGCNIYDAPGRLWNYDPDFQQVNNLPPITPRVVSVEQILFTENFR